MLIFFQDTPPNIEFKYYDRIPDKTLDLKIKRESAFRVNIAALHLYGFYRNSIYQSYSEKETLAQDINEFDKIYEEKEGSKYSKSNLYNSSLYHYAVATSLNMAKDWKESAGKMKCYFAYKNVDGHRTKIGFIHFTDWVVNEKKVIYIAQAGVLERGCSIGRHLMECVLTHYPAGTEFYIVTRVFNTEAKNLYQKRLLFTPIDAVEIQQLGYDDRYCGFHHSTSEKELELIKERQLQSPELSDIPKL